MGSKNGAAAILSNECTVTMLLANNWWRRHCAAFSCQP
jgi:hypothetical protein